MVDQISRAREALPSASCAEVMDYLLETQRLQNLMAVANGANKQVCGCPSVWMYAMINEHGVFTDACGVSRSTFWILASRSPT
jgi:hypothetical protein